jgi:hypothetical protein
VIKLGCESIEKWARELRKADHLSETPPRGSQPRCFQFTINHGGLLSPFSPFLDEEPRTDSGIDKRQMEEGTVDLNPILFGDPPIPSHAE